MGAKYFFALGALLCARAFAAECGPSITAKEVEGFTDRLESAVSTINGHERVLLDEMVKLAAGDEREYAKREREQARAALVSTSVTYVQHVLSQLELLAAIRDQMQDKRDSAVVNRQLSLTATHTSRASARARDTLNGLLPKFTAPGVAYDVGRLRDLTAEIAGKYANCSPPKR